MQPQDLDLFALHAGQIPKPFFDTQIAAAMLGFGAQVAYANLVQRITAPSSRKRIHLPIGAPVLSRPIKLPTRRKTCSSSPLHTHLQKRLHALGRTEWVREEFSTVGNRRDRKSTRIRSIDISESEDGTVSSQSKPPSYGISLRGVKRKPDGAMSAGARDAR